ncbi:16S rRNA (cytosine(967)-C(5))-methyltransferase RsmB [Pseudohalioglobus sediminis]|uniref:16S rRNA (cytosine(967)-C(5))-methyltransferase n=1 Tax=Pseudohalioglobus sediminis TaxID=2606449 RepID=A0A5B0WVP2_9GAMM|nr:16S rRNA (cytosine(967)-C(5))-methyltransferase RsmB [Pseudohalioglobus sediminis]KAA1190567.1 16S rRNA (cytosine(967)-C(5))-methyltransferase RsmB [Pseudohalioglobus sediminis]
MALDTRAAAARLLAEVMAGKSLNQVLPAALDTVAARDRGLLQQLCYGTLRQAPRLQAILRQLLDKPLRDKDRDVQGLLLCGLYQLEDTRIPDHAAVSATVAATRALKKPWSKGLCNAVLRRFLRERDELVAGLDEAARAAHPAWLYRAIGTQWPAHQQQIIAANNSQPPLTLRVNSRQIQREAYLQLLAEKGIEAQAGALSAEAVYLHRPMDVADIPGFGEGLASVQDEAAQLAASLLPVRPGDRVLDACAAPGGKTCHLLERYPEVGEVVAADVDATRLQRVQENLQRLSLQAELLTMDAASPIADLPHAGFDHVLVDAPCSASGVIRRHPDIKLLRRKQDIAAMGAQQVDILHGLWPLLKPGGLLLYVTCSILELENSEAIATFLGQRDDALLLDTDAPWGEKVRCGRQLLPREGGPDGLFFARLQKR